MFLLFPLAKRVIILRVSTNSQDTGHEAEADSRTSIHSAQNCGHRVVHWKEAPYIGTKAQAHIAGEINAKLVGAL